MGKCINIVPYWFIVLFALASPITFYFVLVKYFIIYLYNIVTVMYEVIVSCSTSNELCTLGAWKLFIVFFYLLSDRHELIPVLGYQLCTI